MTKLKQKKKSIFKDIDMTDDELTELWEILIPLQCLNCHKVLKCTECYFDEVFNKTLKFIIKWDKRIRK